MRILYLSYCIPYNSVTHAGGQTLNYYIRQLAKDPVLEVKIVSYVEEHDFKKIDLMEDGIECYLIPRPQGIKRFWGRLISVNSKFNPLHKYCNIETSYSVNLFFYEVIRLKDSGYCPDVIVLEWTQMVLLIDGLKKIYPSCKYVASEHDVSFLGVYRKYDNEISPIKKIYKYVQFQNIKRREIEALKKCDLVYVHNKKDYKLLEKSIEKCKLDSIVPYYHKSKMEYSCRSHDIVFLETWLEKRIIRRQYGLSIM